MQKVKYKFRLYPTPGQLNALAQVTGNCRFVWNHFLANEISTYQNSKKFNFEFKNCKDLTVLKKTLPWLALAPSTALQTTLTNLNQSLTTFLKWKKTKIGPKRGFPRFKVKQNFKSSFTLTMVSTDRNIKNNKFYIPKVGNVECVFHRALPSDFSSCTIKQEAGKWFVVLTVDKPKVQLPKTSNHVGIDLNSANYVCSDGTDIPIPKYLRESQPRIKRLQRSLSRSKKGSQNRKKKQFKLAQLHWHVKQQRHDFAHKLSTSLIRKYDIISLEDLNVVGIQKWNGHIIKDNIFAIFRNMIEYKGLMYGRTVVIVDRWFPSSKTCNSCGVIKNELKLNERIYVCEHCNHVEDRDLNAAKNIDAYGMSTVGHTGI